MAHSARIAASRSDSVSGAPSVGTVGGLGRLDQRTPPCRRLANRREALGVRGLLLGEIIQMHAHALRSLLPSGLAVVGRVAERAPFVLEPLQFVQAARRDRASSPASRERR